MSKRLFNGAANDWPKNLKAYLYCGVTSVVDFGAYAEMFKRMLSFEIARPAGAFAWLEIDNLRFYR